MCLAMLVQSIQGRELKGPFHRCIDRGVEIVEENELITMLLLHSCFNPLSYFAIRPTA
jgi:hypothetical protein